MAFYDIRGCISSQQSIINSPTPPCISNQQSALNVLSVINAYHRPAWQMVVVAMPLMSYTEFRDDSSLPLSRVRIWVILCAFPDSRSIVGRALRPSGARERENTVHALYIRA